MKEKPGLLLTNLTFSVYIKVDDFDLFSGSYLFA